MSDFESKETDWQQRWLAVLLAGLAALFACNEIADFDFWWHLRTGQLIPERGVPQSDWYSFTEADRPWVDVHWGFQVVIAQIHSLFGVGGIIGLKCVLAASTMAIALTAYRRDWSRTPQFWILLLSLVVMSSRFYERPEMVTLLFTSIYLSVLLHADRRPRLLWFLPLVQTVWANVQGLFIFGPILLAMYWMQVVLTWNSSRHKRMLFAVSVLVGLACMASPYGVRNVSFVGELWEKMDPEAGQFYRSYIGELRDIRSFLAEGGWRTGFVWAQFGLMALGAIGVLLRWREIVLGREAFRVLPVVAFSWLGLQAIRNGSHFALVVGILTAWNFGPSFPARRRALGNEAAATSATNRRTVAQMVLATITCLTIAVYFVGGGWAEIMGAHRRFGFGLHTEQFSFRAMDVCAKEGMPDRAALFHLGHAATYMYRCGPQRKVYMDPRLEVHTQQMLRRYKELGEAFARGGDWQSSLDAQGVNLVVASSEHSLGVQASLLCSPYWKCVYWDEIAGVFLRSTWPTPEGVEEFDFRELIWSPTERQRPLTWVDWLSGIPLSPVKPREGQAARRAEHLLRLGQAIASLPSGRDDLLKVILWASAHASVVEEGRLVAPREERVYGIALVTLADLESPRTSGPAPFDSLVEYLRAVGARRLRELTERSSAEISAAYYYQDLLAKHGAIDESTAILERLSKRRPANAAQVVMFANLPTLIEERTLQPHKTSRPPNPPRTWMDFTFYRKSGRLGQLFDLVAKQPALIDGLTLDERIECLRWDLAIGRFSEPIEPMTEHLRTSEEKRIKRDSFHDEVDVEALLEILRGSQAAEIDLSRLEGIEPSTLDGLLVLAAQSAICGDQARFRSALIRAESLGPDPRQKRQLTHLRELLVKE